MNRWVLWVAVSLLTAACGSGARSDPRAATDPHGIVIDGSSTVRPISEAALGHFRASHSEPVSLDVSGTGGGFRKFCAGESTIQGASRAINPEEAASCAARGVRFIELPIAYDGIVVAVHPTNGFVSSIDVATLRAMWRPEAQGQVTRWNQVRDYYPSRELHLYGPGRDSGTFDYFTEEIVGTRGASRSDYTSSEDDDFLVRRVASDPNGLGFFGYSYFVANRDRLKAVAIEDGDEANGAGPIAPTAATIADGSYQPLSRPLFFYIDAAKLERPEVQAFVEGFLDHPAELVASAGAVPFRAPIYELVRKRYTDRFLGSSFEHARIEAGLTVEVALQNP